MPYVLPPTEWAQSETPGPARRLIAAGFTPRSSRLLARRGVEDEASARIFLDPSVDDLHDPFLLDGMEKAVERLLTAGGNAETVVVVGDYDVDGISATALLIAVFRACGLNATAVLPHRMRDGYGFQAPQVETARELGASVIVTADCGSHSLDAVQLAGIDVIITDHHLPGDEPIAAIAHINPHRQECRYPFRDLSGAGLAFKLATALTERAGRPTSPELLLRIACLGTVADMVPLRGENRTIASLGLRSLPSTRSVGLMALMSVSGISGAVRAGDVGFRLGPRINAAGRMDSPDRALELLLTRDPNEAGVIARQLDEWNTQRQRAETQVVEEATAIFEAAADLPPILVAWRPDWHLGVVGIAAGRLSRRFHRPAILLSVEGDLATGSGRSIEGVHLHDFLSPWKRRLERFGGHSQAIGLTVSTTEIAGLASEWRRAAEEWDPSLLTKRYRYEEDLRAGEVADELLEEIGRLEPFGIGNPRPIFRLGPLTRVGDVRRFGTGHIACRARDDEGAEVGLLGWRWGDRVDELAGRFEIVGSVTRDRYTQLAIVDMVDVRPYGLDA
jgi:single-stranded-DNA-specific exonuclease